MARIKHIALHTENPAETAEWYKTVFGLDELRRSPPIPEMTVSGSPTATSISPF